MAASITEYWSEILTRENGVLFETGPLYLRIDTNLWIPVKKSGRTYIYENFKSVSTAGNIKKTINGKSSAFVNGKFQKNIYGFAREPILPDDSWYSFEPIINSRIIEIDKLGDETMFTIRQYTDKEIAELELRANLDYMMMMMNDTLTMTSTTPLCEYYEKLANIPEDMMSSRAASNATENKAFYSRREIFKLYYQMGLFSKDQMYNLYAKDKITTQVYTYITGMPPPGVDDRWHV